MAALIDVVISNPVVTARLVEQRANISRPTALSWLREFQSVGILIEADTGSRGQRRWIAQEVMDLITHEN